jgi:hypothetical protein
VLYDTAWPCNTRRRIRNSRRCNNSSLRYSLHFQNYKSYPVNITEIDNLVAFWYSLFSIIYNAVVRLLHTIDRNGTRPALPFPSVLSAAVQEARQARHLLVSHSLSRSFVCTDKKVVVFRFECCENN